MVKKNNKSMCKPWQDYSDHFKLVWELYILILLLFKSDSKSEVTKVIGLAWGWYVQTGSPCIFYGWLNNLKDPKM